MSIPAGPWTIKSDGCQLKAGDKLTISGSDFVVDGKAWGTITGWDGPNKAIVTSMGEEHKVVYTPGYPKSSLECTYPKGTSPLRNGERAHRHAAKCSYDPGTHTGGTAISWTAEDGG